MHTLSKHLRNFAFSQSSNWKFSITIFVTIYKHMLLRIYSTKGENNLALGVKSVNYSTLFHSVSSEERDFHRKWYVVT